MITAAEIPNLVVHLGILSAKKRESNGEHHIHSDRLAMNVGEEREIMFIASKPATNKNRKHWGNHTHIS